MAISDKLNYLIETKSKFKDRLNSLGAEIIGNTTFRNYLVWLDTFYGDASNKTDLSVNGVVGRTSQDGNPTPENPVEINNLSGDVEYKVRGKNKFDINNALNNNLYNQGTSLSLITDGIRATTEAVSNYRMGLIKIGETNKLIGKTIRVKANFSSNGNNNGRFYIGYCDASGGNRVTKSDTTTSGDTLSMVVESGSGENICLVLYSNNNGTNYTIGNYVEYKNIIMTIDNEDVAYEPYISESFPLSLKSRNLFNKGNYIELNGTPNTSGIFTGGGANYNIVIPCQPNTTYTIQKRNDGNTNRFAFFCSETIPSDADSVQTSILNGTRNDTASEITITTASTAKYLIAHYYRNVETALTKQQLLDSIQIEKSSTATSYEPYYDINLCNISDYKDRIYSQNGEFYLEKKNGKVVLGGSENWNTAITRTSYNKVAKQFSLNNAILNQGSSSNITKSTHFGSESADNIFSNSATGINCMGISSSGYLRVGLDLTVFPNDNSFKSWLSTHNTEVEYVLATPTTTEITQQNYPTLYSQLLAIQEFLTKYKINKEFLLDYSSPEIEY